MTDTTRRCDCYRRAAEYIRASGSRLSLSDVAAIIHARGCAK